MASGDTKTEAMLNVLGNGGSGDEFRGCCNTKTQQYILDAIDRINELDPGGGGEDEIEFVDLTVTNISTDTITVTPNKTTAEVKALVDDGKTVVYRLVVPQTVPGFAAGTYLLQTVMASSVGIMASAVATPTPGDLVSYVYAQATDSASGTIYVEDLGGGDTVYSDKTTSTRNNGGAVYIGNLDANQVEQPDPTTLDEHAKYFWALPDINSTVPGAASVNILGSNSSNYCTVIGQEANSIGQYGTAIGCGATTRSQYGTAIGANSYINNNLAHSVAIGDRAVPTRAGEVCVGQSLGQGYNNTNYRVIGGVHDPVDDHDAATKAYVDAHAGGIKTLTSADYNYRYGGGTPDGIALWSLDEGEYIIEDGTRIYSRYNGALSADGNSVIVLVKPTSTHAGSFILCNPNTSPEITWRINESGQNGLTRQFPVYVRDFLASTSTTDALSANQGRVLKELIDALEARVAALEGN